MTAKVADSIRRGLEEAIAYVEGTSNPGDMKSSGTKIGIMQNKPGVSPKPTRGS